MQGHQPWKHQPESNLVDVISHPQTLIEAVEVRVGELVGPHILVSVDVRQVWPITCVVLIIASSIRIAAVGHSFA